MAHPIWSSPPLVNHAIHPLHHCANPHPPSAQGDWGKVGRGSFKEGDVGLLAWRAVAVPPPEQQMEGFGSERCTFATPEFAGELIYHSQDSFAELPSPQAKRDPRSRELPTA
jgi:hypothetical protein